MYNYLKYFICLVFALLYVTGCNYNFPTQTVNENPIPGNSSRFERFVVLGGSITSGVMDGALYSKGQFSAYPNITGNRFDSAYNKDQYGIPDINSENGINLSVSSDNKVRGKFFLAYRSFNSEYPARKTQPGTSLSTFKGSIDSVNNFSVPGLRSYAMLDKDSLRENDFYNRFADQVASKNLVEIGLSKNPTLILLSIGTDDLYPYILNGASGNIDPSPGNIGKYDATPVDLFEQSLRNILDRILSNSGADIILPTIIDPTDSFYFTILPWYFTNDEISSSYEEITSFFKYFNLRVQTYNINNPGKEPRPMIIFDEVGGSDSRAKTIVDDLLAYAESEDGSVIPKYRQMESDEMLLYSAEKQLFNSINNDQNFATINPAADKYVITNEELDAIKALINSYNNILKAAAQNNERVKLLDFSERFSKVRKGEFTFNGVRFNIGFGQNSIISSDGYFPNRKGHALLANKFLELLNKEYGSRFKPFDINNFKGNRIVADF